MKKKMSRNLSNKRVKKQIRITKKGGVKLNKSVRRGRPSKKTVKGGGNRGFFSKKINPQGYEEEEFEKKLAESMRIQREQAAEFENNNPGYKKIAANIFKEQLEYLEAPEETRNIMAIPINGGDKLQILNGNSLNLNNLDFRVKDKLLSEIKENPERLEQIIVELNQSIAGDEQDMLRPTTNRRYLREQIEKQKEAVKRLKKYLKQSKKKKNKK